MVHIFLLNHLSCSPAEWRKELPVEWSRWDRYTEIITYVLRIINLLNLIDWSRIFSLFSFPALLNLRSTEWKMPELASQLLLFNVLLAFLFSDSMRLTWMEWLIRTTHCPGTCFIAQAKLILILSHGGVFVYIH